jgi:hypothetical protein
VNGSFGPGDLVDRARRLPFLYAVFTEPDDNWQREATHNQAAYDYLNVHGGQAVWAPDRFKARPRC